MNVRYAAGLYVLALADGTVVVAEQVLAARGDAFCLIAVAVSHSLRIFS